ncbi:MAG: HD domain-containing protein [Bacteroidetes bacterium]|nr:HD domain-containing protein [Bacteroidota bacterium]
MPSIIQKAETFVTPLLRSFKTEYTFHNYAHTEEVVEATYHLAHQGGVGNEELEILLLAAWFHDTGFQTKYQGHERESIRIARYFLKSQGYPGRGINEVTKCIQATELPQSPTTKLAEILCDADLHHLATPNYIFKAELLRGEWKIVLNRTYTDVEWYFCNLNFFNQHDFFSHYGKVVLKSLKRQNYLKMFKQFMQHIDGIPRHHSVVN